MNALELHIEEFVLYGFAAKDRYRISEALQAELSLLLTEQGVSPWLAERGEVARLDSGKFEVAPNTTAEGIGMQIAQAVYRGLG